VAAALQAVVVARRVAAVAQAAVRVAMAAPRARGRCCSAAGHLGRADQETVQWTLALASLRPALLPLAAELAARFASPLARALPA